MKRNTKFAAFVAALLCAAMLVSCSSHGGTVMEYEGYKISEALYSYRMATFKRNILAFYSDARDTADFWQAEYSDGVTNEEYLQTVAENQIKDYLIAERLFRSLGLTLDSSVKERIDADIDEKIDYYGGKSALNDELAKLGIDVKLLRQAYVSEAKYEAVYEKLFGDGGEYAPSEMRIEEYYNREYSRIKYIVLYKDVLLYDENGNPVYDDDGRHASREMTEDELRACREKAQDVADAARSDGDFEALVKKYSDTDTVSAYSNGYFVSKNELATWGEKVVVAASSASVGDVVSVEEDGAIFVILKCELTPMSDLSAEDMYQLGNLTKNCVEDCAEEFMSKLRADVEVDAELADKYKLSKVKPNPYSGF